MPQSSVADQYRQEAARLRREAKWVRKLFSAQLIAASRQLEKLAAESEERASMRAAFRGETLHGAPG
jgi:hypothetical protein